MVNKELIKCYVNQLTTEQLKKIVLEVINHYELNEEYYFDTIINNIVNIVNKSSKTVDRVDYLFILKENPSLFENKDTKVVNNSIKTTFLIMSKLNTEWKVLIILIILMLILIK